MSNIPPTRMSSLCVAAALSLVSAAAPFHTSPYPWPNNPFGTHTMIVDDMTDARINEHLHWTLHFTGSNGYVKLFMYPITLERAQAEKSWITFIRRAYYLRLIPILRIGGTLSTPFPPGPHGDYREIAAKIAQIIKELPAHPHIPIYIELGNEPNLRVENGGAMPDPAAYARFLVSAARALRALQRPGIRIANAALSPGGDYNNIAFAEGMCRAAPEFLGLIDVWASHPYPANTPPEYNLHNGTAPVPQDCIDAYRLELAVLAKYTNRAFHVLLTETGYALGSRALRQFPMVDECNRADLEFRAFRDYWSQWPEVLAVTPFSLCDIYGGWERFDWVERASRSDAHHLPTRPKSWYTWVRQLAKPGCPWGTISGKLTARATGLPLENITIALAGCGQQATDINGNYIFSPVEPGRYTLRVATAGFAPAARSALRVDAGSNSVINLALACLRTYTLAGRVRDTAGRPLAGVTVHMHQPPRTTITATNGTWMFRNLPPGRYDVHAAREGFYVHEVRRVPVRPGPATMLPFTLGRGARAPGAPCLGNTGFESSAYGVTNHLPVAWELAEGAANAIQCDSAARYAGFCSLRLAGSAGRTAVRQWSEYSSIHTGRTVRFQVWCRARGVSGRAFLRAKFMSNAGAPMGEKESAPVSGTQGWRLLALEMPAPAFEGGAGRACVEVALDSPRGSAWFDEAHLWELPDEK